MHTVSISKENIKRFDGLLFEPMSKGDGRRHRVGFVDGDKPLGAAVLDETDETVRLESIYIAPEYRRQGFGGTFIDDLLEACGKTGGLFLTVGFPYSREDLRLFFLSCGFVLTGESVIYSFRPVRTVRNSKAAELLFKDKKGRARNFYSMSDDERSALKKYLSGMGYSGDIILKKSFCKEFSSCVFGKDGKVQAFMLVTKYDDDMVVELAASSGESKTALLLTFRHLLECFIKMDEEGSLKEEMRVIFQAARENVVDTALKLFEGYLESDDFLVSGVRETPLLEVSEG